MSNIKKVHEIRIVVDKDTLDMARDLSKYFSKSSGHLCHAVVVKYIKSTHMDIFGKDSKNREF